MVQNETNKLQKVMESKSELQKNTYNSVEELSAQVRGIITRTSEAIQSSAEHHVVSSCIAELMMASSQVQHCLVQARLSRRGHNERTVRALQDVSSSIGRALRGTESIGALLMNEANNAI